MIQFPTAARAELCRMVRLVRPGAPCQYGHRLLWNSCDMVSRVGFCTMLCNNYHILYVYQHDKHDVLLYIFHIKII